jgi:UDP-N-acetylmuramyl tripeptide synthase
MELLDTRRLTGPNLLWDEPGSILDISCDPDEARAMVPVWESCVGKMLDSVGWENESMTHRFLSGGVSLAFSAPIDGLYAATAINEWAWTCIESGTSVGSCPNFEEQVVQIKTLIVEESNPDLRRLEQAARDRGIPFLWDDDEVSLGYGIASKTWGFRELPDPDKLEWQDFHEIPVGLVTGTNGKTTTVRLARHILQSMGRNVGLSSTEWIAVNDRIIDRGDWSGPGGARTVLRQNEVETAILETARGGLLRRGLGVNKADAALITNISEDHLGDYGSRNLEELLNIKWMLTRAVERQGVLVLNADDLLLVEKSGQYDGEIVWFGLDAGNPRIVRHVDRGGLAYVLENGNLLQVCGEKRTLICSIHDIPIAMGGAARHNLANALAAAALCCCLGASLEAVRQGLTSMSQDRNPGRSNMYGLHGTRVVVDFAHNPAAMKAIFDMARALPAKRRILSFGQAGDRPDSLIREMTQCAWSSGLDRVIVSELEAYHRGRSYGDVYSVIRDELMACGARDDQIQHFDEELDSLQAALDWADAGDLIIMLALGGNVPIHQKLISLGATTKL